MQISHAKAVSLVHNLLRGTRIFSVTNIKANGERRKYVICPRAYRDGIKGTGKALDAAAHPFLIKVPDTAAKGWRTVNLETLESITAGRVTYDVISRPITANDVAALTAQIVPPAAKRA